MTTHVLHTIDQEMIDRAVAFHGDLCPGLALGLHAARLALTEVGENAADNPLVAVAETDICALDAIQALVGVTTGNRNLIVRDHGKIVFTFYRRSDGRAIRIAGKPAWSADYQAMRKLVVTGKATDDQVAAFEGINKAETRRMLDADPQTLFTVTEITGTPPATAKVDPWFECDTCREPVMETRTRHVAGKVVCIPCFEATATNGHRLS